MRRVATVGSSGFAAALMHRLHNLLGTRPQLVEGEDAGAADKSVDDERPSRGVNARDAEMGEDENVVCRGDCVGHFVPAPLDAAHTDRRSPGWPRRVNRSALMSGL